MSHNSLHNNDCLHLATWNLRVSPDWVFCLGSLLWATCMYCFLAHRWCRCTTIKSSSCKWRVSRGRGGQIWSIKKIIMYLLCFEIKLTPTTKLRLYSGSHDLYLCGCPYCTWIAINSPNYCVHGCAISPYQMPFLKLKLSREDKAINWPRSTWNKNCVQTGTWCPL